MGNLKANRMARNVGRDLFHQEPKDRNHDVTEGVVSALILSQRIGVVSRVVIAGHLQYHTLLKLRELDPARIGLDLGLRIETHLAAQSEWKWKFYRRNLSVESLELLKVVLLDGLELWIQDLGGAHLPAGGPPPHEQRSEKGYRRRGAGQKARG